MGIAGDAREGVQAVDNDRDAVGIDQNAQAVHLILSLISAENFASEQTLWIGARVGYTRSQFYGLDRRDNGWMAGGSFNYEMWRNLLVTLDYQYSTVHSDAVLSDFARSVYTAGLTWKY